MGTNCALLLANTFLYSYEAEFIKSLLSLDRKRLTSQFNFTYRPTDEVLSINSPDYENYFGQMYPPELEINDTTESNTSVSYLILLLSIARQVNFALSFSKSVTISISILQTVRSWIATSNFCPLMAFSSHNLSDTQGLAPLMNV